ncbi:MAG: hypothetical protein KJO12_11070 [Ignavibacteria bacterium]|nr:hypothetical protein [Ignavibacteria bacterium]
MKPGFYKIFSSGKQFYLICLFLFSFFFAVNIYPQSPTNLEQFYSLTDSLTEQIINELPDEQDTIDLVQNLGEHYSLFSNQFKTAFIKNGKKVLESQRKELNIPLVNISIEGAGVEYGEMFRDGWFGAHYVQRYCALYGNYLQSFSGEGKKEFEFSIVDTVKVEEIKYLQNESFPFTTGKIPPEPFISAIAEPLIAIGIAASVVILFFSVRSK